MYHCLKVRKDKRLRGEGKIVVILNMELTDEKIALIKKALRNGEPEGELREMLKKEGYSTDEINKVLLPHKYDMRSWYLLFGILVSLYGLYKLIMDESLLFLLLGGGLFYAYYMEQKRIKS
jgi:hypothetical protein